MIRLLWGRVNHVSIIVIYWVFGRKHVKSFFLFLNIFCLLFTPLKTILFGGRRKVLQSPKVNCHGEEGASFVVGIYRHM